VLTTARGSGPRAAPGTLTHLFITAIERYDKPDALRYKADGAFQPISHAEILQRVRRIALGLGALGVARGARVAILSENRPEWALVDYACLAAGLPDVPLYPSLPAEQLPSILADAGAEVLVVSTAAQAAKAAAIRAQVSSLRWVIGFGTTREPGVDLTLAELEARGAALDGPEAAARFRAEALAVAPDALATIIYTSGTTGEPKGVMLTHDNIASNVAAITTILPLHADDTCLSFLPLSHIFERMAGHYLMFALGATICYAESLESLLDNFAEVRPTIVFSVPRIYEKVLSGATDTARAAGGLRFALFRWAQAVGARWTTARERGRAPGWWLAGQHALASRLVFSRIRARMGGRIRYFVSGGAPLSPDVARFFLAAGLPILEGYGLTETSPVITVNTPAKCRIGTVGTPIDGVEVGIADDGEILARGPGIMLGYYNRPQATREAIDADGWFHTGDIGELRDGYLAITDRKKDLIVTAGGKKIAPQPIENRVRENRYVAQAVMIGDRRRFPVILVVPNFAALEAWATFKQIAWTDRASLIAVAAVVEKMEREVLGGLTGLANFEMPKRVVLLERDFSVETGELTPTLKVKRRAVDARHKALIDDVYASTDFTAEYAGVPKAKGPPTPA
jgi:long-chain acyl-CoA synthetase